MWWPDCLQDGFVAPGQYCDVTQELCLPFDLYAESNAANWAQSRCRSSCGRAAQRHGDHIWHDKAKAPLHPLGQHFYLSWFVTSDRGVPFVANRLAAHLWPHQAAVLKSLSA